MEGWFDHLIKDVIWRAIEDELGKLEGHGSSAIHDKLVALHEDDKLSSSPLVQVVVTDAASVTLLVRGRFKLFGGAVAPFIRLQVRVSKTVDAQLSPPMTIEHWDTVVGDLQITKDGVFTVELGFGYDAGTWLGRGAFKVIPGGFGLDLLLGGLNERGLMLGLDLHLPAPIPLGSSGAVLTDVGGDFAYNFVPRLNNGVPKVSAAPWDATDYVARAKDPNLDRWEPGAPDRTAGPSVHPSVVPLREFRAAL